MHCKILLVAILRKLHWQPHAKNKKEFLNGRLIVETHQLAQLRKTKSANDAALELAWKNHLDPNDQ